MFKKKSTTVAVASSEVVLYGCPYCGYRSITSPISYSNCVAASCGECHRGFVILGEGLTVSAFGYDDHFPELQKHPRHGIPSHGRPDNRPLLGFFGEDYFRSRGIGLDSCTCFVCGVTTRDKLHDYAMLNNIAAFVQCKAAGERVVQLFKQGARLDYREYEPDWVQVKVGACDRHLPNLKYLEELCVDGKISAKKVVEAIALRL